MESLRWLVLLVSECKVCLRGRGGPRPRQYLSYRDSVLPAFRRCLRRREHRSSGRARQPHARLSSSEQRSEEHTSELQSLAYLVCRLLLEKKKKKNYNLGTPKASVY